MPRGGAPVHWLRWAAPPLLIGVLIGTAWWLWPDDAGPAAAALEPALLAAGLDRSGGGFAPVDAGRPLRFPRDRGAHPAQRTELWDLSGQLQDAAGHRYGLRLSFLRLGLARDSARPSDLAAGAVMLARFALTPASVTVGGAAAEGGAWRLSRAAAGLAGAGTSPERVWLEDWTLVGDGDGLRLSAATGSLAAALRLTPVKGPVSDAQAGLLDRAPGGGAAESAFRYFLLPRLAAAGQIQTGDADPVAVSGGLMLERAWGDAPGLLGGGRGQLAMNRFLLMLDDGSELACVHLRRRTGGGTPIPTCLLIAADGGTRLLERRELTLEPEGAGWASPIDGALYPLHWRLEVPALRLDLAIAPLRPEQEIGSAVPAGGQPGESPGIVLRQRLWSGAVTLTGSRAGAPVGGSGRVDLGGYAPPRAGT